MASGTINIGTRLSNREEITLPFTAPNDGFVMIQLRANVNGRLYAMWSGTFTAFLDGYNVADGYAVGTFPVQKGSVVSTPSSASNVKAYNYFWMGLTN